MNSPAQYFRAGAGAVIRNRQGLVLVAERSDAPGAWQLPQGGLEVAEEPLHAALREVAEETEIPEHDLVLIDSYPTPLAYELPIDKRSPKTGRGQAQYWFLFSYKGENDRINVEDQVEFRNWKWMRFQDLLDVAAEFRKPVYLALAKRFGTQLA